MTEIEQTLKAVAMMTELSPMPWLLMLPPPVKTVMLNLRKAALSSFMGSIPPQVIKERL